MTNKNNGYGRARVEANKEKYKDLLLLFIVIFISLVFFRTQTITVTPDSGWYVSRAINLVHGRGYIDTNWQPEIYRAPVFAGIIALYFNIFGVSFVSAYWVVRTFFVGNLVLSYLLGKKLYNRTWGLIIFLFVLTAPVIYTNSHKILLDIVMPFFVLLGCYWLLWAVDQERWFFFVLSGVTFGIAYLTKATAGVFFAIPLSLIIFDPKIRSKKYIKYYMLFYLALILTLIPWYLYLFLLGENPLGELIKGAGLITNPTQIRAGVIKTTDPSIKSIYTQPIQMLKLFYEYYKMDFAGKFIISPVLLIAWGKIAYDSLIKKYHQHAMILSGGLLYLLLAPIQATVDLGDRHSIILYYLSFFALAGAFWSYRMIKIDSTKHKFPRLSFTVVILVVLLGFQVFIGKNTWLSVISASPPIFSSKDHAAVKFDDHNGAKLITQWFIDHSIMQPSIMVDERFGHFIYSFGINSKPLIDIPYVESNKSNEAGKQDDWIAIWNYQGWSNLTQARVHLVSVSEAELLKDIIDQHVDHIIISPRSYPLMYYLYHHPGFALVYGPDEYGNSIYEVADELKPISAYPNSNYQLQIGQATLRFIRRLKTQRPADYDILKKEYLHGLLKLDSKKIDQIENAEYAIFDEKIPVSHLRYAQRTKNLYGIDGVFQSIELHEEKSLWAENDAGTKKLLVTLYLFSGDHSKAKAYIEELINDTPGDIFAQNLFILTNYSIDNDLSADETIKLYIKFFEPDAFSLINEASLSR